MTIQFEKKTASHLSPLQKNTASFFLILILVLIAYGNSFHASWHFDDYHVIVENPILHIDSLNPDSLYSTLFAGPGQGRYTGDRLYRPVACLTFAINWYFGKDQVVGYHAVNILIHFFSAFLIYLCSISILSSSNLERKYLDSKYSIAFLSALIWAIHPIQTQAVTYIVQRMASLSAMFSFLSIWLYIVGRNNVFLKKRLLCFVGSALAFLLSIGSKQNSFLIPVGMIMIEFLFYKNLSTLKGKKTWIIISVPCFFLAAAGIWYLNHKNLLAGYEKRAFTLSQRLLTEPRVLMMYIGQLFGPFPWRFSIEHDVLPSKSLFEPWTTLPSILIVIGIVGAGIMQIKKRPLVALAILFFFLNHIVESTILPLELAFEHRNYLPSAFVFLPICAGIISLIKRFKETGGVVTGVLYAFVLIIPVFLIGSTFLRNDGWSTEKRLWEDAIEKAPDLARPYQNLASHYYEKIGRYDIALKLYQKALTLRMPTPKRTRTQILTNIGVIYDKAGEYQAAYEKYMEALEASPKELMPRYNAAMALIGMGRLEDALKMTDDLISRKPEDKDSNNLKGSILLKMDRPEEAIPYLEKSLNSDLTYYQALINMGVALYQTGEYERSRKDLEAARMQAPEQGLPLLCLIENRLRANDAASADVYLQKLLNSVTLDEINMVLKSIGKNPFLVPMSYEILAPFIENNIGRFQGM